MSICKDFKLDIVGVCCVRGWVGGGGVRKLVKGYILWGFINY